MIRAKSSPRFYVSNLAKSEKYQIEKFFMKNGRRKRIPRKVKIGIDPVPVDLEPQERR